ncbi:putative wd repeat protein [Phaeomoniella chlamydospora]|uniref:Putative wd repeat protein n=1 Tax=Phaeomoniella chlamydospora TaxID=158046 RepID=A0A0G2E5A4_PHACM|nr:putative wd repeat protein [Phaeomoniella chlamydospora]
MHYSSSESDSDSDSDIQDNSSGIDLENIVPVKRVESSLTHRVNATGSVLSLAVNDQVLFAGLQGGDIAAWKLDTFELLHSAPAHENSVLSLHLSEDKQLLFSGGADSSVGVWSAKSLKRISTIISHHDVGDIFCLAYSSRMQLLLCGTQSQSLQWYHLEEAESSESRKSSYEDRRHKFFDSLGPGQTLDRSTMNLETSNHTLRGGKRMLFGTRDIVNSAHDSYVTALLLIDGLHPANPNQEVLVSGGADGAIKFWDISRIGHSTPQIIHKFKSPALGVQCLAYSEPFLYAGMTRGQIRVYSMESRKFVQKIFICSSDVTTIQIIQGVIFCGTADGQVKRFNTQFTEVGRWKVNDCKILASTASGSPDLAFISGGTDNTISFWDAGRTGTRRTSIHGNDEMLRSLRDLVAFRTISAQPRFAGECNEAASFLRKLCNVLQAETSFLPSDQQISPILLAKFKANKGAQPRKRVLFYGHYDVVDADTNQSRAKKWNTDPFKLTPLNGYLYGRGVSDDKGPIVAAIYAVAELLQREELNCDVVFLLEGQEETGSQGFEDAVRHNKPIIGEIDHVLVANSYWHDDRVPCLTYGMRGVIHATIRIESNMPDRHSGMDGRAAEHEPLKDLTALLGMLVGPDATHVMIPGFYEDIAAPAPEEQRRYKTITDALMPFHPEISSSEAYSKSLQQKWSMPNLTYHQIETPEPKSAVTIARSAEAPISIRVVPGQCAATIADSLRSYLEERFAQIGGSNRLTVQVSSASDAWLGDPHNEIFSTLSAAISRIWRSRLSSKSDIGSDDSGYITHLPKDGPLFIREGGSIPAIGLLEQEFGAPAAMFPCGQSSDNAHLDNERIRVENLYVAREVFREVFSQLSKVSEARRSHV